MKLAYPFLTAETTSPLMAFRGKEEVVFQQVTNLGYTGIELLVRDPSQLDRKLLKATMDKHDLVAAAIGTAPIASDDKITFTSRAPAQRDAAIQRVKEVIQLAAYFSCPINIGKLRGNLLLDNEKDSYEWMCYAFREVAEYAQIYGIEIAIEPQSESNLNYLTTTNELIEFIQMINVPSLKLMLDTYHMNISEKSIIASIKAAKDHLIFMHFADDNRQSPGMGNLPFKKIAHTLEEINYKGFISMEVHQQPSSYQAAKNAIDYLKQLK